MNWERLRKDLKGELYFGGVNVPMATWVYHILNGVLWLSVVGFLVYGVQIIRVEWGKYHQAPVSGEELLEPELGQKWPGLYWFCRCGHAPEPARRGR